MPGKNWIKGAINPDNKGKLRKKLGVKEGDNIPLKKLKAAEKKGGKLAKQSILAQTLRKFRK